MPVATSATSSVGNSSSLQMMHQSKSGSASLTSAGVNSIPPAGKKKCPPSPTPNFNARALTNGKAHIYILTWQIVYVTDVRMNILG